MGECWCSLGSLGYRREELVRCSSDALAVRSLRQVAPCLQGADLFLRQQEGIDCLLMRTKGLVERLVPCRGIIVLDQFRLDHLRLLLRLDGRCRRFDRRRGADGR